MYYQKAFSSMRILQNFLTKVLLIFLCYLCFCMIIIMTRWEVHSEIFIVPFHYVGWIEDLNILKIFVSCLSQQLIIIKNKPHLFYKSLNKFSLNIPGTFNIEKNTQGRGCSGKKYKTRELTVIQKIYILLQIVVIRKSISLGIVGIDVEKVCCNLFPRTLTNLIINES